MDNVDFLNIGYIFLSVLGLIQGVEVVDVSTVPAYVVYLAGQLFIIGSGLAVLLLALMVYVQVQLTIVEHEGFHAKHEAAHAPKAGAELAGTHKNERWERILALSASPNEGDWRRAIIEADIMLGNLLADKGYTGATIGDQLKNVNPLQFTTLDIAWQAHKVRNDIAHGGEKFTLTERDTRAAIALYGRVFEEFGII